MKILLMSDNHGYWDLVADLINYYRDQVDYILHCGDSEFPAEDIIWGQVDGVVKGNMDFDPYYETEQVIKTDQANILLVHGHLHRVNQGDNYLVERAKDLDCQLAFHGHTHILRADTVDGVTLINPGSLNHSRGPHDVRSYALVDLSPDQVSIDYYNHLKEKLPDLSQVLPRS